MTWRENLLQGALDGVPFEYEEVDTEIGRRGQLHEFPARDIPFAEDLGRSARVYRIRAFVIGENYAITRDALAAIIEAGGDHTFTHPYLGDFAVKIIDRVRLKETHTQGRMATFDMTLTESGLDFPLVVIPSIPKIKALKLEVLDGLSTKTRFDLLGAIADVLASVANGIDAAGSAIRRVNGKISSALNLVDNISAAIDSFVNEINTLMNTPTALMNTLTNLVDSVLALVDTVVPAIPPPGVQFEPLAVVQVTLEAVRELFAFGSEASVIPTPTTQSDLEHDAHEQLTATMKAATVAAGSAVLVELELDSAAQAQSVGGELAEMFDDVLEADLDDAVLESLAALKAAMIEHFTEQAIQLPEVTSYTPPTTVPALVLAYDLYGDPDLAEDIVRRNKIRHSAFLLGGRALEVLADG